MEVLLEDSADAVAVTSASDAPYAAAGRSVLSLAVRWPASGGLTWLDSKVNVTPSLAPLLQALVNKVSLAKGSHVQLWLRAAQSSEGYVTTVDYLMPAHAASPTRLTLSVCP